MPHTTSRWPIPFAFNKPKLGSKRKTCVQLQLAALWNAMPPWNGAQVAMLKLCPVMAGEGAALAARGLLRRLGATISGR